jgi:hypothetical protein
VTAPDLARRQAGAALVEALDVLSGALPRAVALAREEERAAERAAVVAWLRTRSAEIENWPPGGMNEISLTYDIVALAIERGEHRREGGE